MQKYQLICMSFDGEFKRESPVFDDIDSAWRYSNDLGSKWYFYPFHFIVSKNTIRSAFYPLEWLEGKRIKTVSHVFHCASKRPETQGMETDEFVFSI